MKIMLEVQNTKKGIKPSKDNIIIYDGDSWYVTTKADLFKEYDERFSTKLDEYDEKFTKKIEECDKKIEEMNAYKKEIAKQLLDIEEIIQKLIIAKGE